MTGQAANFQRHARNAGPQGGEMQSVKRVLKSAAWAFSTRARTHAPEATGRDIVKAAYGRDPILLVKVDIAAAKISGIETTPPHVVWGDIPTPMF